LAADANERTPHAYQQRYMTEWRDRASARRERKELGDVLRRAIEALSARYRDVLFLHDVKNLNATETAWILEIAAGAVRSRLRRPRIQMRDELATRFSAKRSRKDCRRNNTRMKFAANFSSQPAAFASL
jgi:DNA-directed RNA polymerase specialized sigma24 family protein